MRSLQNKHHLEQYFISCILIGLHFHLVGALGMGSIYDWQILGAQNDQTHLAPPKTGNLGALSLAAHLWQDDDAEAGSTVVVRTREASPLPLGYFKTIELA